MSHLDDVLLDELLGKLESVRTWSPRLISKLENLIHAGDDYSLFRVNPIQFANEKGIAEPEAIDLFLHSARLGLFEMEWHLVCATCGNVVESFRFRVANMEAMLAFYSQAFVIQFREVDTYGIRSQFGELDGMTLKFVPIRDDADFKNFPVHQPGFQVADVEEVVRLAILYGGRLEGQILRSEGSLQAAVRNQDGNTIER